MRGIRTDFNLVGPLAKVVLALLVNLTNVAAQAVGSEGTTKDSELLRANLAIVSEA